MQWKKAYTQQIGKAVVWIIKHPEEAKVIFERMLDVVDWMSSM